MGLSLLIVEWTLQRKRAPWAARDVEATLSSTAFVLPSDQRQSSTVSAAVQWVYPRLSTRPCVAQKQVSDFTLRSQPSQILGSGSTQ